MALTTSAARGWIVGAMVFVQRARLVSVIGALGLVLAMAAEVDAQGRAAAVGGPAPEISGGPWINSEPLGTARLRGRVVFVEFWTYG